MSKLTLDEAGDILEAIACVIDAIGFHSMWTNKTGAAPNGILSAAAEVRHLARQHRMEREKKEHP